MKRQADSRYMAGKFADDSYESYLSKTYNRVSLIPAEIDAKPPSSTKCHHVGVNDMSKKYRDRQNFNKIEYENNILLKKMAKIFEDGAQSLGGAPCDANMYGMDSTGVNFKPGSPRKQAQGKKRRPKAGALVLGNPYEGAGNNHLVMKDRQREIARKNDLVLGGITNAQSRYSRRKQASEAQKQEEYARRLRKVRVGWSKPVKTNSVHLRPAPPKTARHGSTPRKSRASPRGSTDGLPSSPGSCLRTGASTAREGATREGRFTEHYRGMDPCKLALSNVSEVEMGAILALKRPPGLIRKVFTALMLLVSPFETSELDITWEAVQEWAEQLGGVKEWLHNLWNFNMAVVPISNAIKTLGYMEAERLEREYLEQFSAPLARFAEWIRTVCFSANERPVTTHPAPQAAPQAPPKSSRGRTAGGRSDQPLDGMVPEDTAAARAMEQEINGDDA